MKKFILCGVGFILVIVSVSGDAFSQDEPGEECAFPLSGGGEAGIYSRYIWRGMELNDEAVVQPEIWLSLLGFELSVWGNMDVTDSQDKKGELTEVDYGVSYSREFGPISASLVYYYYDYPATHGGETQEIGLLLGWGDPLFLGFEAYYDFDEAEGAYLKPLISYSLSVGEVIVTPSVGLGWATEKYNDYQFGTRKDSPVDLEVLLEAEMELGAGFYLTGTVGYYNLVGSDLRDQVEDGKEGFWGGGSAGFAF